MSVQDARGVVVHIDRTSAQEYQLNDWYAPALGDFAELESGSAYINLNLPKIRPYCDPTGVTETVGIFPCSRDMVYPEGDIRRDMNTNRMMEREFGLIESGDFILTNKGTSDCAANSTIAPTLSGFQKWFTNMHKVGRTRAAIPQNKRGPIHFSVAEGM